MTRARSLKKIIRTRAARTGERYTTARRHILASQSRISRATRPVDATPPPPTASSAPTRAPAPAKGSVSDAKAREKTGHGLDHWFAVLDAFDAVQKGHTAAARHLSEAHSVEGWYAQGITVAYERARGVRVLNQRCDGDFEVSASKVVAADTSVVAKVFTDPRLRRRWLASTSPQLAGGLSTAFANGGAKGLVVKANGQARLRLKLDGTVAQFYFVPKPGGKVSVAVQHTKLPSAAAVEERRGQWRSALASLAALVAS